MFKKDLSNSILYNYQKKVILNAKPNFLYKLDVGTGKTYIGIYHYLRYRKSAKINLFIVAPAQKVKEGGWDKSIRTIEKLHDIEINYAILSYDKFKKLKPNQFSDFFIILDECHFIKNYKSKRCKSILEILKMCSGFCLLSATPYSNGDFDLLPYFEIFDIDTISHIIKTKGIYEKKPFIKNYKILSKFYSLDDEKKSLSKFTSNALKLTDLIELPELIEQTHIIEPSSLHKSLMKYKKDNIKDLKEFIFLGQKLSDEQKEMINDLNINVDSKFIQNTKTATKKFVTIVPNFTANKLLSLSGINALERQIVNLSEKAKLCKMFRNESDSNIVIFYNYNVEKKAILEELQNSECYDHSKTLLENNIFEISGELNNLNYNNVDKLKNATILVQYRSGGTGIELQFANVCIFVSPTYSYQDFYQAIGRVYRNGQLNKTTFHYLVTENTIEQKIYDTLINKKDFVDEMNNIEITHRDNKDVEYKFITAKNIDN